AVGEVERTHALGDRVIAPRLEQPRCAGMIRKRLSRARILAVAGPEHAHLPLDLLVGNPGIVRHASLAGAAQLLEDLARSPEGEAVRAAHLAGQVLEDAPV